MSLARPGPGPRRVRRAYVEEFADTLSDRDWAIIESVDRLRLISGLQLERLHFSELTGHSRSVMRWRILKRLADARVLLPVERRVRAAQRDSAKLCYALDSAGMQLARLRANLTGSPVRRPRVPGDRFVEHTLTVTDLYVALIEQSRLEGFTLADFEVEPAWPDGLSNWLRPDAFIRLRRGPVSDYWWYEADLGTETLPTIEAKLRRYLDFVQRGQLGPDGIVPRVQLGVKTEQRHSGIQDLINALPSPAEVMFAVALLPNVPRAMIDELASS